MSNKYYVDDVIWMRVSSDEYELPELIADTSEELARMCGITLMSLYSSMSKYRAGERFSPYRRVKVGRKVMKRIKVIVKRPDEEYGHVTYISNSLSNLQKTVEGYIETVTLTNKLVMICNEEGKLKGLPKNFRLPWGDVVCGTVIICGVKGEDFDDCPVDFRVWKTLMDNWRAK
jgi:hypothetical protein